MPPSIRNLQLYSVDGGGGGGVNSEGTGGGVSMFVRHFRSGRDSGRYPVCRRTLQDEATSAGAGLSPGNLILRRASAVQQRAVTKTAALRRPAAAAATAAAVCRDSTNSRGGPLHSHTATRYIDSD